jgi:PAS domain S-box-containing protein
MAAPPEQAIVTPRIFEASSMIPDITILQRKWQAARAPEQKLPAYEDVVLGSLGRLADYLALVEGGSPASFRILRAGRRFREAVGSEVAGVRVLDLAGDFAGPISDTIVRALDCSAPLSSHVQQAHDGMVSTYKILAMPLACRWGPPLVSIYIREHGAKFNLLSTLFRATEEGMIALSAVRDADDRTVDFRIIDCNEAAARLFRVPENELRWRHFHEAGRGLITRQILDRFLDCYRDGRRRHFELTATHGDGEFHLNVAITPVGDFLAATLTDIRDLKQREVSFRLLFDSNPVPMWLYVPETLKIIKVNDAAVAHYGYGHEKFEKMTLFDLWRDEWEIHGEVARTVKDVYQSDRTWRHMKADGSEIEVLTCGREVTFGERKAVLVTVLDVTERKKAEARIAHMAHHDPLTNLSNRVLFQEQLNQAIARVRRHRESVAVLFHRSRSFQERERHARASNGRPAAVRCRRTPKDVPAQYRRRRSLRRRRVFHCSMSDRRPERGECVGAQADRGCKPAL